jgi:hypothetical protein
MNSIRDHFPNLNEFCLSDSREIIAWMKDHKLGRTYKSIFERGDICHELIDSCPNIEFMIDGIIDVYWKTEHIDTTVIKMFDFMQEVINMARLVSTNRVITHYIETFNTFIKHSPSPARARILLWCVSRLSALLMDEPFKYARVNIVKCVVVMSWGESC